LVKVDPPDSWTNKETTMADLIELSATDLAAMLCSRVCHDLINPVGAIGNGLEVLADPSQAAMADSARDLIANAAKQSRAKLEFARLAYGASSTAGTDIDTRECERVARILFDIEKADLDWQVPLILLPKHKAKLFMNMLLIAVGSVPRGGLVMAKISGPAGTEAFSFIATSDPEKRQKTLVPSGAPELLAGNPPEGVDARGIQPFYTGLLARLTGMEIKIGLEDGKFVFSATPKAEPVSEAEPVAEATPAVEEPKNETATAENVKDAPANAEAPADAAVAAVGEPFAANDQKSA
jgi:histidine phosphotransferase ChpT